MNITRETSKYSSPSQSLCFLAIISSCHTPLYILKHTSILLNYLAKNTINLVNKT